MTKKQKQEASKAARKIVLESMRRFADYCDRHPFWYTNPIVDRREAGLTRAEKARLEDEAAAFTDRVNKRTADANARRIERYKEFGLISSL